jgi:hypothetical protein
MRKFSRFTSLAGVVGLCLLASTALSVPTVTAGASTPRSGRLIDTDLVVGPPRAMTSSYAVTVRNAGQSPHAFGFAAPKITKQPTSVSVTAGSPASFSAAASGSPTPTVQWQSSTNGTTWTAISGAKSTTYSFTATSAQNGNEFEAVFSNFFGRATTSPATLTVGSATPSAPAITLNPTSQSVPSGTTASFSAAASGSPTPTVQWQVSTATTPTFTNIAGATSTTYSFAASTSESGDEYQAVFTNATGFATTTAATLTVTVAPQESSNWSGYADTGATFSAVSATWTVPTVTCSGGATTYSAQWTGIDGDTSSTVEQDGTSADCSGGAASYNAWYEMYGDSAVNSGDEVELSNPVSAGDIITASVSVTGSSWTLSLLDDNGTKWSFKTTVSFSGAAQSSAEWVVERPEVCSRTCSLTTLADFGSVTFSGASATSATISNGPISAYADSLIDMVNGSTVIAEPGALLDGGTGFTDTWEAG